MLNLIFMISMLIPCDGLSHYDIPVKGDAQNGYFIEASVGIPPQRINFLLDTGSSNVAVAAIPQKLTNVNYFAYNNSLTFHATNDEIHLRYVLGDWKGFLASDVLNLCSTTNCSIISNIGCMTSMSDIFDEYSLFQGILGLAYSSISKPNSSIHSFLDIFMKTYKTKNMFSLDLCGPYFSTRTITKPCGNFRIGFSNEYTDDHFIYTPVVHEWYYEITVINLKVGFKTAPLRCDAINKEKTIIDSGTTELLVPKTLYDFIITEIVNYPKISNLSKYWINETICLENKQIDSTLFPTIKISLYHSKNSSFDLHLSPELYLLPVNKSMNNCARLGIRPSSFGLVIGSSILKGFHVLFDRENKRIGFSDTKSKGGNRLIGAVSNVHFFNDDFDQCIRIEPPDDYNVSPLMIVLLIGLCIIAILFLYALLSWIWKYHILGVDNRSDTSSLIEDGD